MEAGIVIKKVQKAKEPVLRLFVYMKNRNLIVSPQNSVANASIIFSHSVYTKHVGGHYYVIK